MAKYNIVAWWSGGITSAATCKLCIDIFGLENCAFIFMDTYNEDEDTYRFKRDCEKWFGKEIQSISAIPSKYNSIQDVWRKYKSLNVAGGAICSTELKRQVRLQWEKENEYEHQAFGYEFYPREMNRAFALKLNYPKTKAIFPLLMMGLTKKDCGDMVSGADIKLPVPYLNGFHNNNCAKTGCVQGGVGYWQKIQREFPDKFKAMADMEHELTNDKGTPVTVLKDQSKEAKESGNVLVFLRKHPKYPNLKSINDMKPQKVEPLFECNGFCGTNDLLVADEQPVQSQLKLDIE